MAYARYSLHVHIDIIVPFHFVVFVSQVLLLLFVLFSEPRAVLTSLLTCTLGTS